MKKVAMIPARLGSKRIPKKNIRYLGDKPLINWVIEATINSNCFDEIYINSESELFQKIAKQYGIKFYKRPDELAQDNKGNDEFSYDFLCNTECDLLIQVLATSPFITPEEISDFTTKMIIGNYDTYISVRNNQIECVYNNTPINFNQKEKSPPSQLLTPIQSYACVLMGWKKENYINNYNRYEAGYHGGDGKIGFHVLSGFSNIDLDNESDWQFAELVSECLKNKSHIKQAKYFE